ncbi:MAG: response regulator [Planctomycetes bacterium]|nr:response regulator [Planctomycetota bacterium]
MPDDTAPQPRRNVLVVDDNQGDFILLREAFATTSEPVDLHHVPDAQSAIRYLDRQDPYAAAASPNLVLIDLGLPPPGGKAVLQHLRKVHRQIPAVVLTGSTRRLDRDECMHLGAVHYAVKPCYFGDYLALVGFMTTYMRHRGSDHPHDTPTPRGSAILQA